MHQPNFDHPTHDLSLVAAHAAGDLTEPDRGRAEQLLASCADCADLNADLLAIAAATHSLPAPRSRRRDFQLEPAVADRLRRGSWLRRLLQPFGSAGSAARPIAAAFTTLGIAGLLIGALLPGLAGGAAFSAPERDASGGTTVAQPAPTAAPAAAPATTSAAAPVPQAAGPSSNPADFGTGQFASRAPGATSVAVKAGPSQSTAGAPVAIGGAPGTASSAGNDSTVSPPLAASVQPPNLLVIGSLALLGIGLILFGLRFAGRRVR